MSVKICTLPDVSIVSRRSPDRSKCGVAMFSFGQHFLKSTLTIHLGVSQPAMRKQSPNEGPSSTTERVSVLVISPLDEDHSALHTVVGHPKYSTWVLFNARDLVSALALLQQHEIAVVVCERELRPGTWTDVLRHVNTLSNAPSLIVTSRLADWHVWANAMSLGAWDVLHKPFDLPELIRSVQSASQHWHDQIHMRPKTVKIMSAGR